MKDGFVDGKADLNGEPLPTTEAELLRLMDWDLKRQTIEGPVTHQKRLDWLVKDVLEFIKGSNHQAVQAFGEKVLGEQYGMYDDYHDTVDIVPVSVITKLMNGEVK